MVVVANPANTNALILSENAPSIPKANISCLTRLDHNRALGQISQVYPNVSPDPHHAPPSLRYTPNASSLSLSSSLAHTHALSPCCA